MHKPVLLSEAIEGLAITPNQWYVDGTFGRGGHTKVMLDRGAHVIGFDVDEEAIAYGQETFEQAIREERLILVRENFVKIEETIHTLTSEERIESIHGVLFDFGVSSPQLDSSQRGFSFHDEAELDMRMDTRLGVKAMDLLAIVDERQLADMFIEYGGEEASRKIAKAIAQQRRIKPIKTVRELVELIERVKPRHGEHLHPATKVFQALRIAVNDELGSIKNALPQALQVLSLHGRLVTISFHEGEDRIVKNTFRNWEAAGKGKNVERNAIQASKDEVAENIRSRSAKLRIFEKI